MALTKVTNDLLALGESTEALGLPKGTTAQRPTSPIQGMTRQNTDDNVIEYYDGTEWKQITATGPVVDYSVDFLVVAGGGGGGSYIAGGGGAGGLRTSYGSTSGGGAAAEAPLTLQPATTYNVTIGAGGTGGVTPGTVKSTNGLASSFATITSIGGGGGGATDVPANANLFSGASGGSGGASRSYWGTATPPNGVPGSGTAGQGYDGGQGTSGGGYGAGGGGAAGPGTTTLSGNTVLGGPGLAVSIKGGSSFTYAAGGRGGREVSPNDPVPSGAANTGTGGDGRQDGTNASGGAGGSGVVILRMPTVKYSGTTTGSPTVTTDGTDTILTYTSSGTYTA